MSDIPQDVIDAMMVKCGRRCCVCRRFRPTKLQVHHIKEGAKGGGDEEDNLIVTCFSCHSDVHTHVPFARRFTQDELKQHRDALVGLVAAGGLPANDEDDSDIVVARVLQAIRASPAGPRLTAHATEILLRAADGSGYAQGTIMCIESFEGTSIKAGDVHVISDPRDARTVAAYQHALGVLVNCGLVEKGSEYVYSVTYDGYLMADELKARGEGAFKG